MRKPKILIMYRVFLFSVLCLVTAVRGIAQSCDHCRVTPKLTAFDFDVQVPQPNATDGTENLWPEWKSLFLLAPSVATNIKNKAGGCLILTLPPSYDKNDEQQLSAGGEVFTNLTSNPNISSDLSRYGDYLITGTITKSAKDYVLHVEVQSSCNRKKVAATDVPFQLTSLVGNVNNLAKQAAIQLGSLADKIKSFEIEERKINPHFAIARNGDELIRIMPAKRNLVTGQETDITIEVNDCDGAPSAGKEIIFTQEKLNGFILNGTIGGIVTPARVITDAQGRAKAKFKLTASSGKPAVINAHSFVQTPWECNAAIIGSVQIDQLPAFKVNVTYIKSGGEDFSFSSNEDGIKFNADETKRWQVDYSYSVVFYPASAIKDGEQVMIMPQFENAPELQKVGKSIVMSNIGYSENVISTHSLALNGSTLGAPRTIQQRGFSDRPLPPSISFVMKNNELIFFSSGLEFPEVEDQLSPVTGSFGIEINNKKYFPVKPVKISDPNSPYKWFYLIEYDASQVNNNNNAGFSAGSNEKEIAVIQIWKSF
jgi:hypothetical protein